MAAPPLGIGTWVLYNAAVDSPRSNSPSAPEQTVGVIRQAIMAQGKTLYQVVWNPGDMRPRSALYTPEELTQIDPKQAQSILQQVKAGTYQPPQQDVGQDYQQPDIPIQAAPPASQPPGLYTR